MKKDELKYDPVRERIISFIEYLDQNRSIAYQFFIVLLVIILGWGYKSGLDRESARKSKSLIGVAQNNYNLGQKDIAISEMKNLVNEYSLSDAANQANSYLMKHYFLESDDSNVLMHFNNLSSNLKDPVIYAYLNEMAGNSHLNIGNHEKALSNFNQSIKLASGTSLEVPFKLSLIQGLISIGEYNIASDELNSMLYYDDLNFSDKSKLEELSSFVEHKIIN